LLFLLTGFRAPDECGCVRPPIEFPSASQTVGIVDAPMVRVSLDAILVDGSPAGDVRGSDPSDGVQRFDVLFNILKGKRELWKQTHPNRAFPGAVLLEVDRRAPARVVKSVLRTAALAGYPSESFVVNTVPGG
jgi:hypothetical protein